MPQLQHLQVLLEANKPICRQKRGFLTFQTCGFLRRTLITGMVSGSIVAFNIDFNRWHYEHQSRYWELTGYGSRLQRAKAADRTHTWNVTVCSSTLDKLFFPRFDFRCQPEHQLNRSERACDSWQKTPNLTQSIKHRAEWCSFSVWNCENTRQDKRPCSERLYNICMAEIFRKTFF